MKYPFPIVRRLLPTNINEIHSSTKIAYYKVRMDKTPPQDELFNLCIIGQDNTAYLKIFETKTNAHIFVAPNMDKITSVMIAPTEYDWDMKYVDVEKQTFKDDSDVLETSIQRYVPYYDNVTTNCLFVPDKPQKTEEQKEQEYKEGIQSYTKQKNDTNKYTIGFLVGGAILFQATTGAHSAFAFVAGCSMGIVYQFLLQYEIDRVGKQMMFVNSASRLAVMGLITSIIMNKNDNIVPVDIWIATTGFLMQKIALWIAFM
jgi:hypothetical protein